MPTTKPEQRRFRAATRLVLLSCVNLLGVGCAGAVESSKREDQARREMPVPICLASLERHGKQGVVSTLQPEDYWEMVLPSYDAAAKTVDVSASDCAGRQSLSGEQFLGADGGRTGMVQVTKKDAVITPAADKFKIVWLRTHHFGESVSAGPLALVRPREGHAEVYAIGTYRGRSKNSRFSLERMGSRMLITASDEGCAEVEKGDTCETSMVVYVMGTGRLQPSAHIAVDKVQYGTAPDVQGRVQYRLTATPVFEENALRVVEQVVVTDSAETELRKSNLERVFELEASGKLRASRTSLWDQVMGSDEAAPPPASQAAPKPDERADEQKQPSAPAQRPPPRRPPPPPPPPPADEESVW